MNDMRIRSLLGAATTVLVLGGCASNPTQQEVGLVTGTVIGGAVGSVLTGGSTVGTVGGAAVGGVIGNEIGKKRDTRR